METVVVSDPVTDSDYRPDIVYLIHYYNEKSESSKLYIQFFDRVKELIGDKAEIVDCNKKVYFFDEMLKTILDIIEVKEEDNPIFINISSGTSEYSAAAIIASLMHNDRVKPFTVNAGKYYDEEQGKEVRGFTMSDDLVKEHYFRDGKPVGLICKTKEPQEIMTFQLERPDNRLIEGLKILSEQKKKYDVGDEITYKPKEIIKILKEKKIWNRHVENESDATDSVYYSRDYMSKWLEYKWVKKIEHSKKVTITEDGKTMLRIFYFDKDKDYLSMAPGDMTEYVELKKGESDIDKEISQNKDVSSEQNK